MLETTRLPVMTPSARYALRHVHSETLRREAKALAAAQLTAFGVREKRIAAHLEAREAELQRRRMT